MVEEILSPPLDYPDLRRIIHKARMSTWLHSRGKSMPVEDLSEDQINDIRECFDLFDADGSGALDMDEVLEACNVLGLDSGDGKGGMIGRLMEEMEDHGIDELDYDQFETVVCRTLGDIALAKSRAHSSDAGLDDNEQATDVLAGTRDRAMVFKRKQLLGSILRGGADLSGLAGAQDELLNEIAARFKRVVKPDGRRSKSEQLAELLNDEDPIANAVAPGLSMRFKHLATLADTKMGQLDALTRNVTPEEKLKPRTRGMSHRNAISMEEKSFMFGGDKLEIRPKQHKMTSIEESARLITSPDAGAMVNESQRFRALDPDEDGPLLGGGNMAVIHSKDFIAEDISALAAGQSGGTVLRSIKISDCFGDDKRCNLKQPAALLQPQATRVAEKLLPSQRPRYDSEVGVKPFPAPVRVQYSKRLPTSNVATPAIALLSGPVVSAAPVPQPGKASAVPPLPLSRLALSLQQDQPLPAMELHQAAQLHQPFSGRQMGNISTEMDQAAPGWGHLRCQTSRFPVVVQRHDVRNRGSFSYRPSKLAHQRPAIVFGTKTHRTKNGCSNNQLPVFKLVSGQWLADRSQDTKGSKSSRHGSSKFSPERHRHAVPHVLR